MCGRVELDLEISNPAMQRLRDLLAADFPDAQIKSGEKYPSDLLPILTKGRQQPQLKVMYWGYPFPGSKKLVINARSETAADKPMFQESMAGYRCILPAIGFYEWTHDGQKTKYLFHLANQPMLYLAGLYQNYDDINRFVILTQAANSSLIDIHQRMPVIIPENQIHPWLADSQAADAMLTKDGPKLIKIRQ